MWEYYTKSDTLWKWIESQSHKIVPTRDFIFTWWNLDIGKTSMATKWQSFHYQKGKKSDILGWVKATCILLLPSPFQTLLSTLTAHVVVVMGKSCPCIFFLNHFTSMIGLLKGGSTCAFAYWAKGAIVHIRAKSCIHLLCLGTMGVGFSNLAISEINSLLIHVLCVQVAIWIHCWSTSWERTKAWICRQCKWSFLCPSCTKTTSSNVQNNRRDESRREGEFPFLNFEFYSGIAVYDT